MDLDNVQVEGSHLPWRDNKEELEAKLRKLPVVIRGNGLKLRAFMGLGKIVYFEPINGTINEIEIADVKVSRGSDQDYLKFNYADQNFDVRYGFQ